MKGKHKDKTPSRKHSEDLASIAPRTNKVTFALKYPTASQKGHTALLVLYMYVTSNRKILKTHALENPVFWILELFDCFNHLKGGSVCEISPKTFLQILYSI